MQPSSDPASDVLVVTPSDSADLPKVARAIRLGGTAGNITVTTLVGNKVVLAFLAGETRSVAVTRIWATGTTATAPIEAMF